VAGYSETSLARKLGFKPGVRIAVVGAPPTLPAALGALPDGVTDVTRGRGEIDIALAFARSEAELRSRVAALAPRLAPAGMLWVAWPKKAARVETDLAFDVVQRLGLDAGLVDVKVCAIDEVWSGLKLVRRLKDRGSPRRTRDPSSRSSRQGR
jgi:hypothetical protein